MFTAERWHAASSRWRRLLFALSRRTSGGPVGAPAEQSLLLTLGGAGVPTEARYLKDEVRDGEQVSEFIRLRPSVFISIIVFFIARPLSSHRKLAENKNMH